MSQMVNLGAKLTINKYLSRKLRWSGAILLAAFSASCAVETELKPVYAASQCKRVALEDARTGKAIIGAEDLAFDAASGRLFISAYDRRGVEKAARKKAFSIPEGGVYTVSINQIMSRPDEPIKLASLIEPGGVGGGLRPHGIAFDREHNEIIFVNRAYQRINNRWRKTTAIERVGAQGEVFVGMSEAPSCAANDLTTVNGVVLVSFDHVGCGWRAGLEDIFGLRRSGLADDKGDLRFNNAAFANGVTGLSGNGVALAATRENALLLLNGAGDKLEANVRIPLPGGPDNLTIAADGGIVAAVHPSLFRIGLHRKLGLGAAPSRIVKADPDRGEIQLLFDDPKGAQFAAATVAVETNGGLIIGSVLDEGLLVCKDTDV